ncbi:extracellular solute-binding protein [Clostridium sp. AF19-22AC]|jgi:raffinose/stachyose/melibiose transport system substrate-binding protein|uniref:extracellular solute-binding protein n=1 Tax=Clostridia TaxID=186801 RepID=UPI000E492C0C|nr:MULTISPECIES: extracellular solute-binding protein [Clostridia]RHR29962.1 extracellular solute-binding protein [Clostridium sp. AF19-22AC]
MWKRVLNMSAATVMIVSLIAGCSSIKTEPVPSDKTVTIRFYSCIGEIKPGFYPSLEEIGPEFYSKGIAESGNKPVLEIVEQFEKGNPNIKVELEVQYDSRYHEKLASDIMSDTLPNVFMHWGGPEMYKAIQSGKVIDLTEKMDKDTAFRRQFSEVTMASQSVRYDDMDGLWGVPFSNVSGGFYYNKALFEKAGITAPPATWNELLDCVEKLKAIDVIPWALGAKEGLRVEHLYSAIFYRLNGVEGAKKLGDRSLKYSSPEAVAAWEEIQKLVDMEAFGPEPSSVDFSYETTLMQTGKAAMTFGIFAYAEKYIGTECDVANDIDFFEVPVFEGKEQFSKNNFGGGEIALGIAANASEEQIEASWKLGKALSGIEGQTNLANSNGGLAANQYAEIDPEKVNRLYSKFVDVMNNADAAMTDVTNYDKVSTMLAKIRDVGSALVSGQLTPEQAGRELDAEVEMYSD